MSGTILYVCGIPHLQVHDKRRLLKHLSTAVKADEERAITAHHPQFDHVSLELRVGSDLCQASLTAVATKALGFRTA